MALNLLKPTFAPSLASDSLNQPDRAFWAGGARGNLLSGFYAFAIFDTDRLEIIGGAHLDPARRSEVAEFIFRVPPKQMDTAEPAAVTVVPTQDGGKFIEHQGQIFKDITLSGTTGLRPNKTPSNDFLGVKLPSFAQPDPAQDTGLQINEATGFDDFFWLRNLFRFYWDLKADDAAAHKIRLLWRNGKDREYYIVEPVNFQTQRSSANPLSYQYQIQLRTIEKLNLIPLDILADVGGDGWLDKIAAVAHAIDEATTFLASVADRFVSIALDFGTTILSPAREISEGIAEMVVVGKRALSVPRILVFESLQIAVNTLESIAEFETARGAEKDLLLQTTKKQIRNLVRAYATIASNSRAFQAPQSGTLDQKVERQNDPVGGQPRSRGSAFNLANLPMGDAIAESTVQTGEDIYRTAQRLLGDAAQWKALVFVNKLVPPYIDATSSTGVLAPGDRISYPSQGQRSLSSIDPLTPNDNSTLPAGEKALGRDLRLSGSPDAGGGVFVYQDVEVAPGGDLALVEGLPNMEQAMRIKFSTEQGELPIHPSFGFLFPLGTKGTRTSLLRFDVNARATLRSDTRISQILGLGYTIRGNQVDVRADLLLRDIKEALAFDATIALF